LKGRALGKQIEYVNSTKIPYLVVLGPREIQSGAVKLKEMATGVETQVTFEGLIGKLNELN
jgi:histidyl-tRNA synthetase